MCKDLAHDPLTERNLHVRVLVVGGTQFNGLALVHELVAQGHDVAVLNRGKSQADIPESVERLVADRTEPDTVADALAGRDWDCVQDMTAYHPEDVAQMIELLAGHVGHYIFASSTVIYAQSDHLPIAETHPTARDRSEGQIEYGAHKLLCEDLLDDAFAASGFPASTVAFSMVYGPHNSIRDREQKMFHRLLAGRPVLIPGDGTTLLQVGHVQDQARALEQMMGKEITFGERYNLTGKDYVTRNGYVDTLAEVTGTSPTKVPIPPEVMEGLWTGALEIDVGATNVGMDIRSSSAANTSPEAQAMRRRFQLAQLVQTLAPNIHWWNRPTIFSIDKLRDHIGWEPQFDFRSMTEQTYGWFQEQGLAAATAEQDWTFEDQLLEHLGFEA